VDRRSGEGRGKSLDEVSTYNACVIDSR
jgi:hypothetical protein